METKYYNYNEEAHKKAAELAEKAWQHKTLVRQGGIPYGPPDKDKFIIVNPRATEWVIDALQPLCALRWDKLSHVTIGLGAGCSQMGEVCSALVGTITIIGLDLTPRFTDIVALRYYAIKFTQTIMHDFKKQFGAVRCRELLGYDISGCINPGDEGYRKFIEGTLDKRKGKCWEYVRWAIMYPLPSEQEELPPPIISTI